MEVETSSVAVKVPEHVARKSREEIAEFLDHDWEEVIKPQWVDEVKLDEPHDFDAD